MKTLALLFLMVGGSAAFADPSALQNNDFADGISHWEGDVHTAGSATDDSGATTGVVVKLRDGDWTSINQDFSGKTGQYILTITYTTTPSLSLSQQASDYVNATSRLGLNGMMPYNGSIGKWFLEIVDSGTRSGTVWQVAPDLSGSGTHTIKTQVTLATGDDNLKGFHLGFPPGSGTINLQSITLAPYGTTSTASTQ